MALREKMLAVRTALAAVAVVLIVSFAYGHPRFLPRGGGGTAPPPGGAAFTKTFVNTAGTATPAGVDGTFPMHTGVETAPGVVGTGQIAVPSVGGVPVRYQVDRCDRPWRDASSNPSQGMCQYSMFLPALAAGGTERVTWNVQSGSYPSTDTCTIGGVTQPSPLSCVTSLSNFHVQLTQVTPTFAKSTSSNPLMMVGFYVNSSGQVTGGNVNAPPGYSGACPGGTGGLTGSGGNCTYNIVGCSGVTPTASVALQNTVTITNAGSGCPITGSGNFTVSFNTALNNGTYNGTNKCGIIRQYLAGPVADGWEIACQFTDDVGGAAQAAPFPLLQGWLEQYKNSDGSVYGFRIMAGVTNNRYVKAMSYQGYTYDMQLYNGPQSTGPTSGTCVRCANQGYRAYTRMSQPFDSIGWTAGSTGQPDWIPVASGAGNSTSLNAIIMTMDATDAQSLKTSRAVPPINGNVGNYLTKVLTYTGTGNESNDECQYASFNVSCLDSAGDGWTGTGNHSFLGPLPSNAVNYIATAPLASDYGQSWLQNSRIGAINAASCQAGFFEEADRSPVNVLNDSVTGFTPSGTMASNPQRYPGGTNGGSYIGTFDLNWTTSSFVCLYGGPGNWDHYSTNIFAMYIFEGDEWMRAAQSMETSNMLLGNPSYDTNPETINGVTYYGLVATGISERGNAWQLNSLVKACKIMVPADPDAAYYCFILLNQNFKELAAFLQYSGSFSTAAGTATKPPGNAAIGYYMPPNFFTTRPTNYQYMAGSQFQAMYMGIDDLFAYQSFPNESTDLNTFINLNSTNYWVKWGAQISRDCMYNFFSVGNFADTLGHLVTGFNTLLSNPVSFNAYFRLNNIFELFANDPEIDVSPVEAGNSAGNVPQLGGTWTTATASAAAGTNVVTVANAGAMEVGSIVQDLGPQSGIPATTTGGVPPPETGAIPHHVFVSAINTGTKQITLTCGASVTATGSCAGLSSVIQSPGVASGDVLVFSIRLDYPDTNQSGIAAPGTPMPHDSGFQPRDWPPAGGGDPFGPSPYKFGTFPPPSVPQMTDLLPPYTPGGDAVPPYIYCPDSANPNGTTAFINQPGVPCSTTTSRIVPSANSAQSWVWWPNACYTGAQGANWENSFGNTSPSGRINEFSAIFRLQNALFGASADTTQGISAYGIADSNYTGGEGGSMWAYDTHF